jgi:hypothetical protein
MLYTVQVRCSKASSITREDVELNCGIKYTVRNSTRLHVHLRGSYDVALHIMANHAVNDARLRTSRIELLLIYDIPHAHPSRRGSQRTNHTHTAVMTCSMRVWLQAAHNWSCHRGTASLPTRAVVSLARHVSRSIVFVDYPISAIASSARSREALTPAVDGAPVSVERSAYRINETNAMPTDCVRCSPTRAPFIHKLRNLLMPPWRSLTAGPCGSPSPAQHVHLLLVAMAVPHCGATELKLWSLTILDHWRPCPEFVLTRDVVAVCFSADCFQDFGPTAGTSMRRRSVVIVANHELCSRYVFSAAAALDSGEKPFAGATDAADYQSATNARDHTQCAKENEHPLPLVDRLLHTREPTVPATILHIRKSVVEYSRPKVRYETGTSASSVSFWSEVGAFHLLATVAVVIIYVLSVVDKPTQLFWLTSLTALVCLSPVPDFYRELQFTSTNPPPADRQCSVAPQSEMTCPMRISWLYGVTYGDLKCYSSTEVIAELKILVSMFSHC